MAEPGALVDQRVIVTGATGQVGLPAALALADQNTVWAVARFSDAAARERLEAAGVTCVPVDLTSGDFSAIPEDATHVVNFAVAKTNDWDLDLVANAEAAGLLMSRCRRAQAFLHCSSTAVYQPKGHDRIAESDPLGDNHRVWEFLATYSICKISAEAVVRTMARELGLPTTIARLNVPYTDDGGWPAMHLEMLVAGQPIPVHPDGPNLFNPIHEDDIIDQVPGLLEAASVPATVVNWAGPDTVSIEEWCAFLGEQVGRTPELVTTDQTIQSVATDTARLHELVAPARVGWQDGFRRVVATRHPELIAT